MKRIRILVLIFCACSVSVAWGQQPVPKVRNWRQFHRGNMERWNPFEKVLNVHDVGKLSLKWIYITGGWVLSSPAVARNSSGAEL